MKKIVLALLLCGYGLSMTQLFSALSDDEYLSFDESENPLLMPATPEDDEENDAILPAPHASNERTSQKRTAREEDADQFVSSSDDSESEHESSDIEIGSVKRQRRATASGASLESVEVELPQREISEKLQAALNLAFFRAAESNNIFCMQRLLEAGAELNALVDDPVGRIHVLSTPLHRAAYAGNLLAVNFLLAQGADVLKLTKPNQYTPLHTACNKNTHDAGEIMKMLLGAGLSVNAVTRWGDTPLHFAAMNGSDKLIPILIQAGANVNARVRQRTGLTPLYQAIASDQCATVLQLLQAGADMSMRYKDYQNALDVAFGFGKDYCAKILIAYGATTETPNCQKKLNQLKNEMTLAKRAFIRLSPADRANFKTLRPNEYAEYMEYFGLTDGEAI